ncbi:serine hydrolase domain-containing protein [Streptomyces macrosporus]|uniref:Serine hydrolase domain-containing protein n=1 Tax=Streptomyces macrosporus TaxID=44032 RepID=A0ABN3JEA8_9ACTN
MEHGGWADEGYGAVADAFRRNFSERGELGAAVTVFVDGREVADLWGGIADERTGRPWEKDTAAPIFSAVKGVTTLCALLLDQEGKLDLDAPVARYWPEFARHGKERITTRTVLAHRAGLPALDRTPSLAEITAWTPVVRALEEQEPLWEPGEAIEYHGHTFGFLVGEVIRRITGLTPGAYLRRAVADELGLRTWIGVPEEEIPRLARVKEPDGGIPLPPADSLITRILTMNGALVFPGTDDPHGYGSPRVLAAEFPGAGGASTARGLATLYAAAATGIDGVVPRLLSRNTLDDIVRELSSGPSWSGIPDLGTRWGTGFKLDCPSCPMLGPRSFGHDGAGGPMGFGDDEYGVGFGYVANHMLGSDDDRVDHLVAAVRKCLGA